MILNQLATSEMLRIGRVSTHSGKPGKSQQISPKLGESQGKNQKLVKVREKSEYL